MRRDPPIKAGWIVVDTAADGWAMKHPKGLFAVCSYGFGWDHASVSRKDRIPSWEDMCFVKDALWDPTDCVVQYHPAKAEYINAHPFVLHLWRPQAERMPMPPRILV